MERSERTFHASECRCTIPLAIMGLLLLLLLAIALITGQPIG